MQGFIVGLQARMNVSLRLANGSEAEVECVIDTGFEGFLTLPPATIERLGLMYAGSINANLADDSNVSTKVYWTTIIRTGTTYPIY
jgi:predicted aspartyl protease